MNLKQYIIAQIKAVDDAGVAGYFVWNAASDYRTTWAALAEMNGQQFEAVAPTEQQPTASTVKG